MSFNYDTEYDLYPMYGVLQKPFAVEYALARDYVEQDMRKRNLTKMAKDEMRDFSTTKGKTRELDTELKDEAKNPYQQGQPIGRGKGIFKVKTGSRSGGTAPRQTGRFRSKYG